MLLFLVFASLATWRISNFLSDTDQSGPFGALDWIRDKLGVRYDDHNEVIKKPGSMSDLITCVYCNSVWIGLIFTIMYIINQKVTIIVSMPFALSALAIFVEEWRTRL